MKKSFSIQKVIEDYLARQYARGAKEVRDFWRVSDMGKCLRGRFYKRLGYRPTNVPDARALRKLQTGHIFHWWFQKRLEDAASKSFQFKIIGIEEEVRDAKLNLVGHYDALVQLGRQKLVYDFKTVHSNIFHYRDKHRSIAQDHHVLQLATYLMILGRKHKDLKEARLLYISKDDLSTIEVPVKLTPEIKKKILAEVSTLNKAWQRKKLPPAAELVVFNPLKKKWVVNWQAEYCSHHDLCLGQPTSRWLKQAKALAEEKNRLL